MGGMLIFSGHRLSKYETIPVGRDWKHCAHYDAKTWVCFQSANTPTMVHTADWGHDTFICHNAQGALNHALQTTVST